MFGLNAPYAGPQKQLSTDELIQLGLAAFRPPAAMQQSSVAGGTPQGATPGFNMGGAAGQLSEGMGSFLGQYFKDGITAKTVPDGSYTAGLGADGLGTLSNSGGFGSTGSTFWGFGGGG